MKRERTSLTDPIKNDLVSFFLQRETKNSAGFCFNDLFRWGSDELEYKHDYIQWFFPLHVPSQMHPSAPVIHYQTLKTIRATFYTPFIRKAQRNAFDRMLGFYGFKKTLFGYKLVTPWYKAIPEWVVPGGTDHNYLRITRILTSLMLFGDERTARRFLKALITADKEYTKRLYQYCILPETMRYWKDAVEKTHINEIVQALSR